MNIVQRNEAIKKLNKEVNALMNEKINNKKIIEDQEKNIKKLGDMYLEQTDQNKKLVKELDKSTGKIVEL